MMHIRVPCGLLMLQLICCCNTPSTATPPPTEVKSLSIAPERANNSPAPDDLITSGFFNGNPIGAKEAWSRFTPEDQYRAARKDDFKITEAARSLYGEGLDRMAAHPYVGGNINHDDEYHDFAVIVVS